MEDLSDYTGAGLLWALELYEFIGPAGLILIIGPLLGLLWHYTFRNG